MKAWSHRQWILSTISSEDFYTRELDFIHKLLLVDVRNNSAWNQRWFATHKGCPTIPLSKEDALEEAGYAWSCIVLDVWNESPWRYFLGVGKEQCLKTSNKGSWEWGEWEQKLELLAEEEEKPCHILMGVQVDILEIMGDNDSRTKVSPKVKFLPIPSRKNNFFTICSI